MPERRRIVIGDGLHRKRRRDRLTYVITCGLDDRTRQQRCIHAGSMLEVGAADARRGGRGASGAMSLTERLDSDVAIRAEAKHATTVHREQQGAEEHEGGCKLLTKVGHAHGGQSITACVLDCLNAL